MSRAAKLAVLVCAFPVVAACGGSSSGGGGGDSSVPADNGPVQHPTSLKGEVGEDNAYVIELTDQDGKDITNLAAGTYKLAVEDYSTIHNFHLTGGGVNEATTVGEKTKKTFTVTFKPGDYSFQCDPHASQMHGSFHVT